MLTWKIEQIENIIGKQKILYDKNMLLSRFENWIKPQNLDDDLFVEEIICFLNIPATENFNVIIDQLYKLSINALTTNETAVLDSHSIAPPETLYPSISALFNHTDTPIERNKAIHLYSSIYLNTIESKFAFRMAHICFLDSLSRGQSVKLSDYLPKSLSSLEKTIRTTIPNGEKLLYGFDRTVRNAIAHSKIDQTSYGSKIIFIDSYKQKSEKKIYKDREFRYLIYNLHNTCQAIDAGLALGGYAFYTNYTHLYAPILTEQQWIRCFIDTYHQKLFQLNEILQSELKINTLPYYILYDVQLSRSANLLLVTIRTNCLNRELIEVICFRHLSLFEKIVKFLDVGTPFNIRTIHLILRDEYDHLLAIYKSNNG